MSNIEGNSSLHYTTGRYLGLINDYLVSIKENSKFEQQKLKEIEELFLKLKDDNSVDPQIQLLGIVIEHELRKNNLASVNFFNTILKALKERLTPVLIKELKHVIVALDGEYSRSLSKIKR